MVEYPGLFADIWQMGVDVLVAGLPVLLIFIVAQLFIIRMRRRELTRVVLGLALAGVGLWMFLQGVHVTYVPLGRQLGERLISDYPVWLLVTLGFALGFIATIAEPAVRILNSEIEKVSAGAIRRRMVLLAISSGVGLSVALAMVRAVWGLPLWYFLLPGYVLALVALFYMRRDFGSIAFDAAAVATGPMTVTFIVALVVGVASGLEGRDPLIDGFGLVALVALMPILTVLALGMIYTWRDRTAALEAEREQVAAEKG